MTKRISTIQRKTKETDIELTINLNGKGKSNTSTPMQESLANIAIDISGRSEFVFNVKFHSEKIGNFDTELIGEFLEAFCVNAGVNLHVNVPYGTNAHHIAEAIFKGLAKALKDAVGIDERRKDVPSTKGIL